MKTETPQKNSLILLTGASGYVGGRLLRALETAGYRVRCLARRPEFLKPRVDAKTEIVKGDVLDPASLQMAMAGVDAAYYLIHAMGSTGTFEEEDRRAAGNFGAAARTAGVRRIIYLGGLGCGDELSPHLASRQEVGRILRESGVPAIELRASIIIGSGSLSFEMIRALVQKLPIMITPRWTRALSQPMAIEDIMAYLIAALDVEYDGDGVFEIGGADQVSYGDLMKEYARQRGLKRLIIPVPVLTPKLSSLWLGLVTPLYARVGRKLIDSVRHDTVVTNPRALKAFAIRPRGIREAIARALVNEDQEFAATRWSDALSSPGEIKSWGGVKFGTRLVDSRAMKVLCSPEEAMKPIRRIGGQTGWYFGHWLWHLRGLIDLLCGGVGMRRGRRDPEWPAPGDTVDFWRVEAFEPARLLRLFAEMKLPGRAWLQFEIEKHGDETKIRQTAIFDPAGMFGLLYWYALYPLHQLVFSGMLRGIVNAIAKEKGRVANENQRDRQPAV
ncbi:MAG: SDR family oxidoreductase [candidate division KSB1 bacterium]|nr:SDR family oxidoreductase [candidate division KSB1 bacterium]MDZ7404606.1 SDR family oxidoreductase [candidate division KSB1 bacterium]